ncbi:MAG: DUF4129 domain-containing protein [Acidimicrobiia bacterium]|nr:DUF4129 domain-containing protein [Acidimicrobiia bacterium]
MNFASILVMTVMAGCLGQIVGRAFDDIGAFPGLVLGVLTGLAAGVIAAVRPPDPAGLTWRRIEFFAFPLVGLFVLTSTGGVAGVLTTVVTLVIVVAVRTLVESTAGDLGMMERMLDDRPTGAPADRLRLRMLGVGLLLASVAGYTIGVEAGFTDLGRPAVGGQMIAVVLWFGLGIVSIGAVSRQARQRAWRVNGVEVSDRLADRWAVGVAGAALVVVMTAVVVPIATGQVSALPAQAISETDGLNRWVTRALELLSRDTGANEGARSGADDENANAFIESFEADRGDGPDWLGYVLLAGVIGTIFLWAIRAGRNARFAPGGSPVGAGGWSGVKTLLAALGRELKALFATFVRLFKAVRWRRPTPAGRLGVVTAVDDVPVGHRWSPADPTERRIARSFAAMAALEIPRRGETPAEVARAVGTRTDPAGAATVLGGYLRARYSPEQVEAATADSVEQASRRITERAKGSDLGDAE